MLLCFPSFSNAKPVRRILTEAVAVCKEYNVSVHYKLKHGTLEVASPLLTVSTLMN